MKLLKIKMDSFKEIRNQKLLCNLLFPLHGKFGKADFFGDVQRCSASYFSPLLCRWCRFCNQSEKNTRSENLLSLCLKKSAKKGLLSNTIVYNLVFEQIRISEPFIWVHTKRKLSCTMQCKNFSAFLLLLDY